MKNLLLLLYVGYACTLCAQEYIDNAASEGPDVNIADSIEHTEADDQLLPPAGNEQVMEDEAADTLIHWINLSEAEAAQAVEPKKIFVHIYASWCRWCRLSDSVAFRHPVIAQFLNRHFYSVRLNGETQETIRFRGNNYRPVNTEGHTVHELTEWLLRGKISYPGFSFLNEEEELLYASNGYLTPAELETVLHYCQSGACYEEELGEFEKHFLGKIPE